MIKFQEGNFWDIYPVYRYKKPFKYIYDKHKKTKKSSNMAWFVYLYSDVDSEFFTYNEEVRRQELEENLTGEVYDIPEVQKAISEYDEHMCSMDERAFKQWSNKLLERSDFLSSRKYIDLDFQEAKDLDTMLEKSLKIWDAFKKIKEQYEKSKDHGTVMGGGEETFLEQ